MVTLMERTASLALITKFVRKTFPLVDKELANWREFAAQQAAPELSRQALASINDKKFHCQGGSIFSLYPNVNMRNFTRLVVALQTISDYLDNLCDRGNIADEQSFRQLHLAMTDALDPDGEIHDYYAYYPVKDDGGYLVALVTACREETGRLPAYGKVRTHALDLAQRYSELQTYKHLTPTAREQATLAWAGTYSDAYPELSRWEIAAASGSTLGLFILCAIAADRDLTEKTVQKILAAYFPWICGLHILLDYFIDLAEDNTHGDLNFVTYYKDAAEITARLTYFSQQAFFCARELPDPVFSETIIHGLLALYLSDPKTTNPPERDIKTALLANTGNYTRFVYALCRLLRKQNTI